MLQPEKQRLDKFTILVGIAGLAFVVWGAFAYAQNAGWLARFSTSTPPAAVAPVIPATSTPAGDYSAIGSTVSPVKTLQAPVSATTTVGKTGATKPATVAAAPIVIPIPTLPFKAPIFNGAQWNYDWGAAYLTDGSLSFGAATTTSGGDLFLASSSSWTNYAASANVNWISGASFGIVARAADLRNFVYCNFAAQSAQIVLRTNGVDATVAQSASTNGAAGVTQDLGINVYGNEVACTVNGAEVLGATISSGEPISGGIGLISWDKTLGLSRISINNLRVTALQSDTITAPFPAPVAAVQAATATQAIAATSSVVAPAPMPPATIPYSESNFTNDTNWQRTWGVMATSTSGAMEIGSAANSSGGSTILTNTSNWLNYKVAATLDWNKGQTFMIIARYADTGNYVACNFVRDPNMVGAVTIELEKFVNGNEATLQTGEDPNFSQEGNTNIAVSLAVQDTQATCSFNGRSITNTGGNSYGISPIVGGIGFSTWDPTLGNTDIVVKNVSVAGNY